MNPEQVISQVDPDRWNLFCEIWRGRAEGFEKYFDLRANVDRVLRNRLLMQQLRPAPPHYRVLDISAGFCALGLIARHLGHMVTITDIDIPVVKAAQAFLGFHDRVLLDYHTARGNFCFAPIPPQLGRFRLISSVACPPMICWHADDWALFFEDAITHLEPEGRIFLWPNRSSATAVMIETVSRMDLCFFNQDERCFLIWKE